MGFLRKLFGTRQSPVIIVSGLPRSGTSMMMCNSCFWIFP